MVLVVKLTMEETEIIIENAEELSSPDIETQISEVASTETQIPDFIDYSLLLKQTNTYLNFLIYLVLLFMLLMFTERK